MDSKRISCNYFGAIYIGYRRLLNTTIRGFLSLQNVWKVFVTHNDIGLFSSKLSVYPSIATYEIKIFRIFYVKAIINYEFNLA